MALPLETFQFTSEQRRLAMWFIVTAGNVYNDKDARRDAYTQILRDVLHKDVFRQVKYEYSNISQSKNMTPDGHKTIRCSFLPNNSMAVSAWEEIKAEIGTGNSDPNTQSECDYISVVTSNEYRHIREVSCCPAFLFGYAGPYPIVNGAIFTDKLVSERLTPGYFYLGPRPLPGGDSDLEHGVERVAQLLQVTKECLDELEQFYLNLEPTPPQDLVHSPHFRQYKHKEDVFQLTYVERLVPDCTDRIILKAEARNCTTEETSIVVVKFTNAYSREEHELLARHSLAPALRYYGRPDDVDMAVIVMDFVEGEPMNGPLEDENQIQLLRQAITLVYGEGLVLGDLRGPNVLIDSNKHIQLIDLDWCGPEGSMCYPSDINLGPGMEWHPEVMGGEVIKKEHDYYMIKLLTGEEF